jgi:hypothetical protein
MKWHCSCAALAALLTGCGATGMKVYDVQHAAEETDKRFLVYALPRTVVTVDVALTRTDLKQGVCSNETSESMVNALRRLGIEQLKKDDEGAATSIGDVALAQRMEPDPGAIFAVELTSDLLDSSKFAFEMSEEGILTSGSLESSNEVAKTTVQALSTAANIAGALVAFGGKAPSDFCLDATRKLVDLRAKRESLVGGGASTNGTPKDAIALMLSELNALDAGYAALFEGKKTVTTTTVHCELTPPDDTRAKPEYEVELMSVDDSVILADPHCVVAPSFRGTLRSGAKPTKVTLELAGDASVARAATRLEPKNRKYSGLRFRLPVRSAAVVATEKAADAAGEPSVTERQRVILNIPQFGDVVSLPGHKDLQGASLSISAKLGSAGGLVSFGQSSSAPDAAAWAEAIGTSGTTVLDAVKAKRDGKDQAEVEALELEKKRLELIRDIQKLKTEGAR